jgi:hypothetical protein
VDGCICCNSNDGSGWLRLQALASMNRTTYFQSMPVDIDILDELRTTVVRGIEHNHSFSAQFENVSGQADQTASEYVSVGVLSAPFHGAGADGCKYFTTNKDGSAIPAATLKGYIR